MSDDDPWLTRETLLQKVRRQHDQRAWEEFVYYYKGYVHNLALRMNLRHHDAEEVVQTVMLKLWQKLPDFEYDQNKGRFRGWLCIVTSNEVKMRLRLRANRIDQLSEAERGELHHALSRSETLFTDDLADREWASYIANLAWERVLPHISDKEKQAFEDTSRGELVPEIAQRLGLSESSVYVYKKRVRDRLREEVIRLNRELD